MFFFELHGRPEDRFRQQRRLGRELKVKLESPVCLQCLGAQLGGSQCNIRNRARSGRRHGPEALPKEAGISCEYVRQLEVGLRDPSVPPAPCDGARRAVNGSAGMIAGGLHGR